MEAIEREGRNCGAESGNHQYERGAPSTSIESIPGERDLLGVINSNLVIRRSYRFFPGDLRRDDDVTTDPIWRLGLALIVAGADRRLHRHHAFIQLIKTLSPPRWAVVVIKFLLRG